MNIEKSKMKGKQYFWMMIDNSINPLGLGNGLGSG